MATEFLTRITFKANIKMKFIAILSAVFAVSNALLLHPPYLQSYVSAVPSVLTHSRVAIPASIPTTVSEVVTSARTVPEHRFTSSEWVQPTSNIIPAVRQYTVRTDIPVAVRSVHYEPTVEYTSHLRTVAAPALTLAAHPYVGTILKR